MSNSPMTGPVNTGTYPHFTPDPKGENDPLYTGRERALRATARLRQRTAKEVLPPIPRPLRANRPKSACCVSSRQKAPEGDPKRPAVGPSSFCRCADRYFQWRLSSHPIMHCCIAQKLVVQPSRTRQHHAFSHLRLLAMPFTDSCPGHCFLLHRHHRVCHHGTAAGSCGSSWRYPSPSAGLLVTGYALGVVIAGTDHRNSHGFPAAKARAHRSLAMCSLLLGNLFCAIAPNYWMLMIARDVISPSDMALSLVSGLGLWPQTSCHAISGRALLR